MVGDETDHTGTQSNHTTLLHWRASPLAKPPRPPFVKGGSAMRGRMCHRRSCA